MAGIRPVCIVNLDLKLVCESRKTFLADEQAEQVSGLNRVFRKRVGYSMPVDCVTASPRGVGDSFVATTERAFLAGVQCRNALADDKRDMDSVAESFESQVTHSSVLSRGGVQAVAFLPSNFAGLQSA
jgi:hypothetical protein